MEAEPTIKKIDIFILGAGPAGLSALYTLQKHKFSNYVLIDFGKSLDEREKYDNADAFLGIGGAGLYSDGKFSFYPCGTKVWLLPDQDQLFKSYEVLSCLFSDSIDFNVPPFPKNKVEFEVKPGCFNLKEYPSYYLSFEKRVALIRFLCESGEKEGKILMRHSLLSMEKTPQNEFLLTVEDQKSHKVVHFLSKWVILAGGKYFPIYLGKIYQSLEIFRRIEYGVRIFGPNTVLSPLFENRSLIDPKWVCPSDLPGVEYRTFCMCQDGEVILCKYNGIKGYSGRSDCPPTGHTNLGFNAIIRNQNLFDFKAFLHQKIQEFEIPLTDALDAERLILEKQYGEIPGKIFRDGLKLLIKQFNIRTDEIKLIGPTLEGVGTYPAISEDLSLVGDEHVFVGGDSSGIFRGIIPSMISGIYITLSILKSCKGDHK